jgi:RNA polymerase sigma-70 factor (sigma-E family)
MPRRIPKQSAADESFEAAFKELFVPAYRVARRIVGDPGAAEDVAAEALSRAYADWARVSQLPYRDAWVLRVATNLALSATRRRHLLFPGVEARCDDDAATTRVALAGALHRLPARQREVVVLRHLAGLSEPEVAVRLGVSLGTVKTHLRRGHEALRGRLAPEGLEVRDAT